MDPSNQQYHRNVYCIAAQTTVYFTYNIMIKVAIVTYNAMFSLFLTLCLYLSVSISLSPSLCQV